MIAKDSHRPHRFPARMTAGLIPALVLAVMCLWNNPAAADFRLCNNTSSRVGIALGFKDAEAWTTEGWWNVSSRACETLLRGTLVARFYYISALDYDRGGERSGQALLCPRDKASTLNGTGMLAHYKPDNGSSSTFNADTRAMLTDSYLARLVSAGLFAWSFMDDSNVSASSSTFSRIAGAIKRYGR